MGNALKSWEKLDAKRLAAPQLPSKLSIRGWESCAKDAEALVKHLKECDTQLDNIISAASKANEDDCRFLRLADVGRIVRKFRFADEAAVRCKCTKIWASNVRSAD